MLELTSVLTSSRWMLHVSPDPARLRSRTTTLALISRAGPGGGARGRCRQGGQNRCGNGTTPEGFAKLARSPDALPAKRVRDAEGIRHERDTGAGGTVSGPRDCADGPGSAALSRNHESQTARRSAGVSGSGVGPFLHIPLRGRRGDGARPRFGRLRRTDRR